MKRIVIVLGAILLVAVAALLVTPSFIDWTNYRNTFETQLANATGRQVGIDGDVSLALLPRPAFQVNGVRIASLPGASSPDFARAEQVAVNLAFGPLLRGRLQFISIEVIDPVIYAEVLEDGSATWDMTARRGSRPVDREARAGSAPFNLGVDVLSIINGTVIYQDSRRDIRQDLTGLTVDLAVASTSGPFDAVGEVTAFDIPWQIDSSLGELRRNRPGALVVVLSNDDADLTIDIVGSLTLSETGPVSIGRLTMSGSNAVETLAALGIVQPDQAMPAELRNDFNLESRFELRGASVFSDNLTLRWGRTVVDGTGFLEWEDDTEFRLDLGINRLDLDSWRFASLTDLNRFARLEHSFLSSAAQAQTPKPEFSLPSDIKGQLDLRLNLIEWRGQVMRNGRITMSLADAQVNVTEARLTVPGNASFDLAGVIGSEAGRPTFDLTGRISSRDLRSTMDWLDLSPQPDTVPPSRLNSLSGTAHLTGSPSQLVLQDIDLVLDTTQIKGTVSHVADTPAQTTLDLTISSLDLDSYLPALGQRLSRLTQADRPDKDAAEAAEDTQADRGTDFLAAMRANVTLRVDSVTAGNIVYDGVHFDGELRNGEVAISSATVDSVAGAKATISGTIQEAFYLPRLQNFQISIASEDFARVHRALDLDLPQTDLFTGSMRLAGIVSGSFDEATLDLTGSVNALSGTVKGSINSLSTGPTIDLIVTLSHEDYGAMMTAIGQSMAAGIDGKKNIRAEIHATGSPAALQFSTIEVQVGENGVTGTLQYDASQGRPNLTGTLALTTVKLDELLPSDPTEEMTRASLSRGPASQSAVSRRWSGDPIDLGVLRSFDADIAVTADRLVMRGLDFDDLQAQVHLSSGVLTVNNWQGNLYGGPSSGNLSLKTDPVLELQTRLVITDAALDRLGGSLAGSGQAQGKFALQGQFSAQGKSQRDLVASLNGAGAFAATGIDASRDGQGLVMAAVLAPVRALSQLGGVFSGGTTEGFASIGAEFQGAQGVFSFSEASLTSNVYSGAFSGTIDLPRWWVDASGRVRLEVNVITQLLGSRLQMPSLIPVTIQGPLDLPNVTMLTDSGQPDGQTGDPSTPAPASPLRTTPTQLFQGILNEFTRPR